MKALHIHLSIDLPADAFEAAAVYEHLRPAWKAFLEAIEASGAKYDLTFSERPRRNRKRKPRLVTPPGEAA
ncbi:MAG TPA: hypothetical protein VGI78_10865 [Acetobacteraceae bacterium]|jgi:hypothetical protein